MTPTTTHKPKTTAFHFQTKRILQDSNFLTNQTRNCLTTETWAVPTKCTSQTPPSAVDSHVSTTTLLDSSSGRTFLWSELSAAALVETTSSSYSSLGTSTPTMLSDRSSIVGFSTWTKFSAAGGSGTRDCGSIAGRFGWGWRGPLAVAEAVNLAFLRVENWERVFGERRRERKKRGDSGE